MPSRRSILTAGHEFEAQATLTGWSAVVATLERAIAIAAMAHEGQVDEAGMPYVLHPLRMMLSVDAPEARMAAVLHDVVEDTAVTLDQLRGEGFSEAVIEAVEALTRRDDEDYEAFIRRVAPDTIARKVTLADLRDNCDLSRIMQPILGSCSPHVELPSHPGNSLPIQLKQITLRALRT